MKQALNPWSVLRQSLFCWIPIAVQLVPGPEKSHLDLSMKSHSHEWMWWLVKMNTVTSNFKHMYWPSHCPYFSSVQVYDCLSQFTKFTVVNLSYFFSKDTYTGNQAFIQRWKKHDTEQPASELQNKIIGTVANNRYN